MVEIFISKYLEYLGWRQISAGWIYYIEGNEDNIDEAAVIANAGELYSSKYGYERGAQIEHKGFQKILKQGTTNTWQWFYFNDKGIMQTGWVKENNIWYYLKDNGVMAASEWIQLNGKWYYLKSNGAMCQNENYTINGKSYNFDSNGVCTNP